MTTAAELIVEQIYEELVAITSEEALSTFAKDDSGHMELGRYRSSVNSALLGANRHVSETAWQAAMELVRQRHADE